jgi:hypothetical protein
MVEEKMNMKKLLFNPNGFFSEQSENKINLKMPFLIVLLNGILAIASSMLVMKKAIISVPSDLSPYMTIGAVIGTIGGLIGAFLGWLIIAGVFYLISCLFDSEGSFKRTVEFIGYGYMPKIFTTFVGLLVLYSILPSIDFSLQNPQIMQQSVEKMVANNPLLWISEIIGILCIIWSANIWIFALSHARNMSIKDAVLTVTIPVGLVVIYSTYNLVSALT